MRDTTHVKGLSELDKYLSELTPKMERNVLRGAMRAGAKPVEAEVKANLPVKTGQLRAGVKTRTSARGGIAKATIRATGKHAYIAPWLEFGVGAHRIVAKAGKWLLFGGVFAKSIDHPGFQPRPVWRPALASQASNALVAIGGYIKNRLATKHGIDAAADVEIEAE